MSNIQPKKQDLDGVEYLSANESTNIKISGDDSSSNGARIELGKDLTTTPIISHLSGDGFDFGVLGNFTFPQMVLAKEKLQAVVTPLPATDTLKINKKILLDDGAGNTGTLDINGTDLEISSSGNQLLGGVITIDTANNRVGINVPNPTEDFEIDGNIQMDTGSFSKIVFYDKPNNHEHGEIDAGGEGTNGGRIRFQTKVDGGSVTEKLRITANGRIGLGGANYGTAGQVLTSNGASAPTWTTPSASVKPYISMSVGVIDPTYNNGSYYSLTGGVWGKASYVSPIHGIGNTYIQQDIDNSFTGLFDATAGTITIPAGFGGFYSISWSASVQRASTSTISFIAQLGSGVSNGAFFSGANSQSYITSGTYKSETALYTEYSRFVMEGVVYLPAGQTIAVWNLSNSNIFMGGDYSPAYFRVAFLGF